MGGQNGGGAACGIHALAGRCLRENTGRQMRPLEQMRQRLAIVATATASAVLANHAYGQPVGQATPIGHAVEIAAIDNLLLSYRTSAVVVPRLATGRAGAAVWSHRDAARSDLARTSIPLSAVARSFDPTTGRAQLRLPGKDESVNGQVPYAPKLIHSARAIPAPCDYPAQARAAQVQVPVRPQVSVELTATDSSLSPASSDSELYVARAAMQPPISGGWRSVGRHSWLYEESTVVDTGGKIAYDDITDLLFGDFVVWHDLILRDGYAFGIARITFVHLSPGPAATTQQWSVRYRFGSLGGAFTSQELRGELTFADVRCDDRSGDEDRSPRVDLEAEIELETAGDSFSVDLLRLFPDMDSATTVAVRSSSPHVVAVVRNQQLVLEPDENEGEAEIVVTAAHGDGRLLTRRLQAVVEPALRLGFRRWRMTLLNDGSAESADSNSKARAW